MSPESNTPDSDGLYFGSGANKQPNPGVDPHWFEMMTSISSAERGLVSRAMTILRRKKLNLQTAKDVDWQANPLIPQEGVVTRTFLRKIFQVE